MKRPAWLRWPLVSREWADTLEARVERRENERAEANRQRADLAEKYTAVCIANGFLTHDLAKAREDLAEGRAKLAASMDAESALARQIHELAQPVEPTDSEMDSINLLIRERDSEKKRADQLQEQLAEAVAQAADSLVGQLRAELKREKRRADQLQKQYDEATTLADPRLENGRNWQQTRQDDGRKQARL